MCLIDQKSCLKFDLLLLKVKVLVLSLIGFDRRKKVNSYNNLIYFHFIGGMLHLEIKSSFFY